MCLVKKKMISCLKISRLYFILFDLDRKTHIYMLISIRKTPPRRFLNCSVMTIFYETF